jgi:hypothetical protein
MTNSLVYGHMNNFFLTCLYMVWLNCIWLDYGFISLLMPWLNFLKSIYGLIKVWLTSYVSLITYSLFIVWLRSN